MIHPFNLADLAIYLNATLLGNSVEIGSVSINSRTIKAGDLFVAIVGEQFDGHDFTVKAIEAGAAAIMVERAIADLEAPQLVVANTRIALGQLGALNRAAFKGTIIGITGSTGKTTVKELVASVLANAGDVLATKGNLNNELGVPLTLLELTDKHQMAVIEMGASGVGEIAYSVSLVKPDVVIITNASDAHVGKFGGLDKVVEAKGEILEGLTERGIAVLNKDDPSFDIWQERAKAHPVISFSKDNTEADYYALDLEKNEFGYYSFTLHSPAGDEFVQLNIPGQHNISNALAAAAACQAIGIDLKMISKGFAGLLPVKGRTNFLLTEGGARVIDDTYNASPASVKAAIDLLSGFSNRRRVLVLGDMGELGEWAEQIHQDIGEYAQGKVDSFYAVGPLMSFAIKAFGRGGNHFETKEALSKALQVEDDINITLLIKGSRGMAMETVVSALCGSEEGIH